MTIVVSIDELWPPSAESLMACRTCEGYASVGAEAVLVAPVEKSRRRTAGSVATGATAVRVVRVPIIWRRAGLVGTRMASLVCGAIAALLALGATVRGRDAVIHVRLPAAALMPFAVARIRRRRIRVVYETHVLPRRRAASVLRRADAVVVNSSALRDELAPLTIQAPLLLGLGPHLPPASPADSRPRPILGLPHGGLLLLYAGFPTAEQADFLDAALGIVLGWRDATLVAIGNQRTTVEGRDRRAPFLLPPIEPSEMWNIMRSADVLVYTLPRTAPTYLWATPGKLFDYQASGRPIVSEWFPRSADVLGDDGDRARITPPNDPRAFAEAIRWCIEDPVRADAMARRARLWSLRHTWDRRAKCILGAVDRAAHAARGRRAWGDDQS